MLSKTIETLKYLLLEYRFYFLSIALLLALLIYSYNKTLSLEKELNQKQITFERRQKAYDEKAKQQREKLERMIKEINLHK
jgi:hypothetical protein